MINISNQMIISLYPHCILVLVASGVIKRIPHFVIWTVYTRETRALKSLYGYLAVLYMLQAPGPWELQCWSQLNYVLPAVKCN